MRVLAPLLAILLALALVALLTQRGGRPDVLRLSSGPAGAQLEARTADSAASGSGGYVLVGELPAGKPADSPVFRLVGPYDQTPLAKVLDPKGITVAGGAWWWSPCYGKPEADTAGEGPDRGISSGCAATTSGTVTGTVQPAEKPTDTPIEGKDEPTTSDPNMGSEPTEPTKGSEPTKPSEPNEPIAQPEPTEPSMTPAQARDVAKPVFDALGLDVRDAVTVITPYGATVRFDPVVNGLPTMGYSTRVDLNQDRTMTSAGGFLGRLDKGDDYPLDTAKAAFDKLPSAVRMMMCPQDENGDGCTQPPPPEVTGAQLGLQLRQLYSGEHALVPAWLFAVKGQDEPVAQIAIDEEFLGGPPASDGNKTDPGTEPGTGGTEPGTGGGGRGEPGTDATEPAVAPAPPTKP